MQFYHKQALTEGIYRVKITEVSEIKTKSNTTMEKVSFTPVDEEGNLVGYPDVDHWFEETEPDDGLFAKLFMALGNNVKVGKNYSEKKLKTMLLEKIVQIEVRVNETERKRFYNIVDILEDGATDYELEDDGYDEEDCDDDFESFD